MYDFAPQSLLNFLTYEYIFYISVGTILTTF
jgi:hypothetical protein